MSLSLCWCSRPRKTHVSSRPSLSRRTSSLLAAFPCSLVGWGRIKRGTKLDGTSTGGDAGDDYA